MVLRLTPIRLNINSFSFTVRSYIFIDAVLCFSQHLSRMKLSEVMAFLSPLYFFSFPIVWRRERETSTHTRAALPLGHCEKARPARHQSGRYGRLKGATIAYYVCGQARGERKKKRGTLSLFLESFSRATFAGENKKRGYNKREKKNALLTKFWATNVKLGGFPFKRALRWKDISLRMESLTRICILI